MTSLVVAAAMFVLCIAALVLWHAFLWRAQIERDRARRADRIRQQLAQQQIANTVEEWERERWEREQRTVPYDREAEVLAAAMDVANDPHSRKVKP